MAGSLASTGLQSRSASKCSAEKVYDDEVEDYLCVNEEHKFNYQYNRELACFANPVSCVSFSQDGEWFVSGSLSGDIKVWDAVNWGEVKTLKGVRKEEPTCLLVSPSQRWIVSTQPLALMVFKFETPFPVESKVLAQEIAHNSTWIAACFSPVSVEVGHTEGRTGQDNHLAAITTSHLCIIDYSSGWKCASRKTQGSARCRQAQCICYTACGGHLLVGYSDGFLQAWNAYSLTLSKNVMAHTGCINCLSSSPHVVNSPVRIATGGIDGYLRLWSSEGWVPEHLAGDISCDASGVTKCEFSASGQWLVSATTRFCVWRVRQKRAGDWVLALHQQLIPMCSCDGVRTIAISCINDSVLVASRDGFLGMWTKHAGLPADMLDEKPSATEMVRKLSKGRPSSSPARPMRKMSDISTTTEQVMQAFSVAEKTSPKNWVQGKLEPRPIARNYLPGVQLRTLHSALAPRKNSWVEPCEGSTCFSSASPQNSSNVHCSMSAAAFVPCMEQTVAESCLDSRSVSRTSKFNRSKSLGSWSCNRNARFDLGTVANAIRNPARRKSCIVPGREGSHPNG
jgi:WD40 repeat protein